MIDILKRTNKKERMLTLISVIFIVLQVWLDLKIPDYMSEITRLLQLEGTQTIDVLRPGILMIGFSLASLLASLLVGYFAAKIAAGLGKRLRKEVYTQVLNYSAKEIQKFSIPSLVTRTTNDVTQIQQLVAMGLQVVIKGPITAIWAVTKIAHKNWEWSVVTGVAVLLLLCVLAIILIFVEPKFKVVQGLTDQLNGITRESLTGIRVIRAYNAEEYQDEKFEKVNQNVTKVHLFTNRLMATLNPGMTLVSSGLTLAVYWIGAYLIEEAFAGEKLVIFSDMVVFTSYAMQVVMGFMLMSIIFLILPRALVSARRINEVLTLDSSLLFPNQVLEVQEKGQIEFKQVSFTYPNASEAVLTDIHFTVKSGETLALIGSTGSGKSTIVNLVARLFDRRSGEIKLNGYDIKDYSREELNNIVGYIPQKPILFRGTIRSNIEFGKSPSSPLSEADIYQALAIAQAEEFVMEQSEGLESIVAQDGKNFSGGQKQRLGIARVIARKPEILVFDDSFSALDYQTDHQLRSALSQSLKGTTKIIVAQRVSTIMEADQIIVLEKGQIVGQGTHLELLKNNQVYQEIAFSQLSKEELSDGKIE